jgi:hypothetical protein
MLVFMLSARYCCQILTKLEYSRQFFEKSSNVKFIKIVQWDERKTDRPDVDNSRYSQFCEIV